MYKFWGPASQKFGKAKKSRIRLDIRQLSSLTANILETDRDIKNQKQI